MNWLLCFLIFIYFLGPRIGFGARVEDLVILASTPFIFYFLFFKKRVIPRSFIPYLIFYVFSLILAFYGLLNPAYSIEHILIPFFKISIYISAFILFYVAARYFDISQYRLSFAVLLGVAINLIWVSYQILTGRFNSFFPTEGISSYGVVLVGEAAAFQVGMMLGFATIAIMLMVGQLEKERVKIKRWLLICLVPTLVYAIYLSQSRISLFIALLSMLLLYFIAKSDSEFISKNRLLMSLCILLGGFLILLVQPSIIDIESLGADRFSARGVDSGIGVRVSEIWNPLLKSIADQPLLGKGFGTVPFLTGSEEAHNYFLRVLAEGGVFYLTVVSMLIMHIFNIARKTFYLPELRNISVLLCLILVSVVIAGLVQESFLSNKVAMPLYAVAGICSGLFERKKANE